MISKRKLAVTLGLMLLVVMAAFSRPTLVMAHNTNTVHPRITAETLKRIVEDDELLFEYTEMYKKSSFLDPVAFIDRKFWGGDPKLSQTSVQADETERPIFSNYQLCSGQVILATDLENFQ